MQVVPVSLRAGRLVLSDRVDQRIAGFGVLPEHNETHRRAEHQQLAHSNIISTSRTTRIDSMQILRRARNWLGTRTCLDEQPSNTGGEWAKIARGKEDEGSDGASHSGPRHHLQP